MRVAMVAPPWLSIPPRGYGGIENVIHALIPELLHLGVEVELFTVGDSTTPATKRHFLYKTGQYEHIHKPQYDSFPILAAHLLHAQQAIVKDGGFDIIHDHTVFVGPMLFASSCENLPPVIHTLHGPPFMSDDRAALGIPDSTPMWEELARSKRLYLVPISQAMADSAPHSLRRRMMPTVHNSIDVASFVFNAKKSDYFMTLARAHPDKGQTYAIQACLELGEHLKMAGTVAGLSKPKQVMMELANPSSQYRGVTDFRYFSDQIFPYLCDGQIEYVGDLSGTPKMELMNRAKALLFPIQWNEPFGMAPIEALACGTPVIALARGALPEIIEHGVNGFLAKNMDEFKKYMNRVGEIDPAACRESVLRKFSAPVMAQSYLKRYKEVISRYKKYILRSQAHG